MVEEREKVFGTSQTISGQPRVGLRSEFQKLRIVYLPRIQYIATGAEGQTDRLAVVAAHLDYKERRKHFVNDHLRRAVDASPRQLQLAEMYGVMLPKGYTWVRPHWRGESKAKVLEREAAYRSRSALQCLYRASLGKETARDGWFNFERNVWAWLAGSGFEVNHYSANKRGDGGVDIQAEKEGECYLIQCKYWVKPVGVEVVREMLGTLVSFPRKGRGVIMASASLTAPARDLARKNGILFIENMNFLKPIRADLNLK